MGVVTWWGALLELLRGVIENETYHMLASSLILSLITILFITIIISSLDYAVTTIIYRPPLIIRPSSTNTFKLEGGKTYKIVTSGGSSNNANATKSNSNFIRYVVICCWFSVRYTPY